MQLTENIRPILKNGIYLILVQFSNYILPLLTIPFLMTRLNAESFGIYVYSIGFIQILMIISDFGFNLDISKRIAENSNNLKIVSRIFNDIIFIKTIILFILSLIFIPMFYTLEFFKQYNFALTIAWIALLGSSYFPVWYFQGMNLMKHLSIINTVSKLLTYPLIFIFVRYNDDFLLAIFLQNLSYLIASLIAVLYLYNSELKKYLRFNMVKGKVIGIYLKSSWPLFLSNSLTSLLSTSFVVVLGFFSTNSVIGAYGAIEKIVKALCFSILSPLNQAFFPVIAKFRRHNIDTAKRLLKMALYLIVLLLSIVVAFYFILENFIVDYIFLDYVKYLNILRVSILTIIPIGIGGVLGQLGLIALGDDRTKRIFSNIYIYITIICFPICVLIIYLFNIYGAVCSFILTQLLIVLFLSYYSKKNNLI